MGRLRLLGGQQQREGLGVEPVPGQDGHVLPEGLVAGGTSAAQIVVVHRREVVVDERVRVDELERRGQGQDPLRGTPDRPRRGQRQHRADALAAGQQRIAHGLVEARSPRLVGEAQLAEIALDLGAQMLGVGGHGGVRHYVAARARADNHYAAGRGS